MRDPLRIKVLRVIVPQQRVEFRSCFIVDWSRYSFMRLPALIEAINETALIQSGAETHVNDIVGL